MAQRHDRLPLPTIDANDFAFVDTLHTGTAATAAASQTASARRTTFDTVAEAAPHLSVSDVFGAVAHDLTHPSRVHVHDYFEVTHALEGVVLVWVEGTTCVLEPGSTILVKPDARHLISPVVDHGQAPWEVDLLIRPDLMEQCRLPAIRQSDADAAFNAWLHDPQQTHCHLPAGHSPAAQAAMSRLLLGYCHQQRYRLDYAVIGNLLELLHAVDAALGCSTHVDPLIARITAAIADDVAHASNAGIADRLGYSVGYLSRYAKARSGHTLGQLINEERLRTGAELLVTSPMTVAEVAQAVGYDSASYFHAMFRQRFMVTPRTYRKDFQVALGQLDG